MVEARAARAITSELGSIPLWREYEKARLDPRLMDKQAPAKTPTAAASAPQIEQELPKYPMNLKDTGEGIDKRVKAGILKGEDSGIIEGNPEEDKNSTSNPATGELKTIVPIVHSNARAQADSIIMSFLG